jgi:SOS-response transcriptional repressor LexA
LISWVQAGNFASVVDNYHPGDGEDFIPTTIPIKRHTFALRVQGDSMEDEFKDGAIIFVEPDMEAQPGDYVVVRTDETESTFKQLIRDGADLYLKPLNPRYPIKPFPVGGVIVGVVRGQEKRYR